MIKQTLASRATQQLSRTQSLTGRCWFRPMKMMTVLCVGIILNLAGCGNEPTEIPVEYRSSRYWALRVNYPAVQLSTASPYDTVRLMAIPHGFDGAPLSSSEMSDSVLAASPTKWYSTDSAYVEVNQDGLVRARKNTDARKIYVIATRQLNWVTHTDTTWVAVNDVATASTFETFQLSIPDSLKRAAGTNTGLILTVTDNAGNPVPTTTLPLRFAVSGQDEKSPDVSFQNSWNGTVRISPSAIPERKTTVSVRTWAYGVAYEASFQLEIGWPIFCIVGCPYVGWEFNSKGEMKRQIFTPEIDLGPGAEVSWSNYSGWEGFNEIGVPHEGDTISVVFDDPTNVLASAIPSNNTGGGNMIIPGDTLLPPDQKYRVRRFVKVGTYDYTIQPFGARGRIIVHAR